MDRIEQLVADLEALNGPAREKARELLAAVLKLHRAGLARMLEIAAPSQEQLARDPLVSSLLVLHDLHPHGLAQRLAEAVESARGELDGCSVEIVSIEACRARVRLDRRAGYHRAAEDVRATLRERILAVAPDLDELIIEGTVEPGRSEARLVQLGAAK
jgi:hypothetical protein